MPYLNLRVSIPESSEAAGKLVAVLMQHTTGILGKKAEVTSIQVDFVDPARWFIGGTRVGDQTSATFFLEIIITEGTNTKMEKSKFINHVFTDLQNILGPTAPASYIVIHDMPADSWGFQGRTQEYRFIQSLSL